MKKNWQHSYLPETKNLRHPNCCVLEESNLVFHGTLIGNPWVRKTNYLRSNNNNDNFFPSNLQKKIHTICYISLELEETMLNGIGGICKVAVWILFQSFLFSKSTLLSARYFGFTILLGFLSPLTWLCTLYSSKIVVINIKVALLFEIYEIENRLQLLVFAFLTNSNVNRFLLFFARSQTLSPRSPHNLKSHFCLK